LDPIIHFLSDQGEILHTERTYTVFCSAPNCYCMYDGCIVHVLPVRGENPKFELQTFHYTMLSEDFLNFDILMGIAIPLSRTLLLKKRDGQAMKQTRKNIELYRTRRPWRERRREYTARYRPIAFCPTTTPLVRLVSLLKL